MSAALPPATGRLVGRRIVVFEARATEALAAMFEREGAEVLRAPALAEQPREASADVARFLDALSAGSYAVVIFQTGVGTAALLDTAERLGRLDEARAGLARTTTLCRGPKPTAVMKRHEIPIAVSVPAPWTTNETIEAVRALPIRGRRVALLHYGERNDPLADAIVAAGASLDELMVYKWTLPDDVGPLERAVEALCGGGADAATFTTQVQVRHLFEVARRMGRAGDLEQALRTRVVVAAVGPTSAATLQEFHITPHVVPEHPKMGPMVAALVDYLSPSAA
jgi:uroporphyrinogen-III synthase